MQSFPAGNTHRQGKRRGQNPEGAFQCGIVEDMLSWQKMAIIGTLPILAIHLWVSFLWGMGASIGLDICGILMAVLIGTTGLGVKIGRIIPWSYPVKMAMFPVAYSLLPSTMIVGSTMQLILELALSITFFVIFLLGGIIWFHKWEGKKVVNNILPASIIKDTIKT